MHSQAQAAFEFTPEREMTADEVYFVSIANIEAQPRCKLVHTVVDQSTHQELGRLYDVNGQHFVLYYPTEFSDLERPELVKDSVIEKVNNQLALYREMDELKKVKKLIILHVQNEQEKAGHYVLAELSFGFSENSLFVTDFKSRPKKIGDIHFFDSHKTKPLSVSQGQHVMGRVRELFTEFRESYKQLHCIHSPNSAISHLKSGHHLAFYIREVVSGDKNDMDEIFITSAFMDEGWVDNEAAEKLRKRHAEYFKQNFQQPNKSEEMLSTEKPISATLGMRIWGLLKRLLSILTHHWSRNTVQKNLTADERALMVEKPGASSANTIRTVLNLAEQDWLIETESRLGRQIMAEQGEEKAPAFSATPTAEEDVRREDVPTLWSPTRAKLVIRRGSKVIRKMYDCSEAIKGLRFTIFQPRINHVAPQEESFKLQIL